jgi:glutamate N-acetyltransferase / amino-acid N-acetyltransferase
MNPPQTVIQIAPKTTIKVLHEGHIGHVQGFRALGVHANIKKRRRDICLIASDRPATCAGVFTQNAVVAAPVTLSRKVAKAGRARAIICNSGNANAVTGERGLRDAARMQELVAEGLGIKPGEVLVASTGVIGQLMPMDKVEAGIREAVSLWPQAEADGTAAEGIMTTDTVPKEIVIEVSTPAGSFRIGGIAKGSGMIEPNMATMLGFVATDVAIEPAALHTALSQSADESYNLVSVDHDTSTNDMCLVLANGASGIQVGKDISQAAFQKALHHVNLHLAKAIARDGEGATKLLTVEVTGGATRKDARKAAKAIINSPLVKTAVHGADPNWGRILAATGYSGARVDLARVSVKIGDGATQMEVLSRGEPLAFDREAARTLLRHSNVTFQVDLGLGTGNATAYGCDLSHEYVDINAHYTT